MFIPIYELHFLSFFYSFFLFKKKGKEIETKKASYREVERKEKCIKMTWHSNLGSSY